MERPDDDLGAVDRLDDELERDGAAVVRGLCEPERDVTEERFTRDDVELPLWNLGDGLVAVRGTLRAAGIRAGGAPLESERWPVTLRGVDSPGPEALIPGRAFRELVGV